MIWQTEFRSRMNLIDAVAGAGASPLSNPLTQFLLQTGANLIGGRSSWWHKTTRDCRCN